MKSKHIIAITALAFASLTSCTSVLDKDDLTAVSEKATWNSEILSTAFLDKCYKDNLPSFSGDYSKYSDEGNGGGDFIHGRLTAVATAGGPLGEHWPYDKIYTINVLLTSIDGGSLSEDIRNRIKAQALFLRAYQYFEMVKIYGGVPLILTPQDRHNDDLYVTRQGGHPGLDGGDVDGLADDACRGHGKILGGPAGGLGGGQTHGLGPVLILGKADGTALRDSIPD